MNTKTLRILLADDDQDDYIITRDLLGEIDGRSFDIDWVSTFEAAKTEIERDGHDVYLVDYRLGKHNGLDLIKSSGMNSRRAPVIMLTGQGDHNVDVEAMKAGAADYLVKGQIHAPALERAIRYAIERKQAEQALKSKNAFLEAQIEATIDGVVLFDEHQRVVKENANFRTMWNPGRFSRVGADYRALMRRLSVQMEGVFPAGFDFHHAQADPTVTSRGEINTLDGRVFDHFAGPVLGDDGRIYGRIVSFRDITEYREAQRELAERADRESLLNDIWRSLRSSLDPEEIETKAIHALAKALNVDRCYFLFFDASCSFAKIAREWRREGLAAITGEYDLANFWDCDTESIYRDGRPLVIDDVRSAPWAGSVKTKMKRLEISSFIRVPLFENGRLAATLGVAMAAQARVWTPAEIMLVETVAAQVQCAVNAATIHQRERNIALTLQNALQPTLLPEIPGLDIGVYYKPALAEANIGGDFYDVFPLGDGRFALVLGDMSGKGLAAATQVSTLRNMLRCVLYLGGSVTDAVAALNAIVEQHCLLTGFVRIFVALYDPVTRELDYASCGHETAYIQRNDQIIELSPTGPPIGISDECVFEGKRLTLRSGDALVACTDGLIEAALENGEMFGHSRLKAAIAGAVAHGENAETVAGGIIDQLRRFTSRPLRDDISLFVAMAVSAETDTPAPILSKRNRFALHSEAQQTALLGDVLLAATGGRLRLKNDADLKALVTTEPDFAVTLNAASDATHFRGAVSKQIVTRGASPTAVDQLNTCAMEAATNVIKHAGGGTIEAWVTNEEVLIRTTDHGPGIPLENLAQSILELGFSTRQTLGMGFTMMLAMSDWVAIATSSRGTSILLRIPLEEPIS
ncbi:hypothetical protein CCAX7_24300 [Capsulimonas corticalis]|uniref:Uncharacterized protein n=1 Tax=Capsulimonas corticalis TaxID=2219043 RepID=A0A402CVD9_9BACT|nr:SpoIIE family protein phosphatase [Capsulimonas corticalis]BDI30379.1 hypothetical protein CCAX7_24300 [Capsulimonas corticalis]